MAKNKQSRRRFLQTAAASAAVPLAAVPAEAADPPASADAALLALVRLRFRQLTAEQFKAVQTSLQRNLAAAEVLRRIRLDPTDDEPATVFVSDLAE